MRRATRRTSSGMLPCALAAVLLAGGSARGGKNLEGIACRSVHLGYAAPKAAAFYNEITVEQSAAGTYFMVCGFRMGYFGIQELGDGRKVVLFSVWDPGGQNNPNAVDETRRVRVLHHDPDVVVRRFGGEGTGGQSFYTFDWEIGRRYRFLVRADTNGNRTAFSGHFYLPEAETWKHLVTFETITGGHLLEGCHSFVEDFRRNRVSTTHTRRARFGNGWVRDRDGAWHALTKARFTADGNPVRNIDAGVADNDFFLATGGNITNTNTPLWKDITRPAAPRPPELKLGP